jgi:hypothetical protein
VLTYWADRLNALVCTTRPEVIAALDVILGDDVVTRALDLAQPARIDEAQIERDAALEALAAGWSDAGAASRRRSRARFDEIVDAITAIPCQGELTSWRLTLGVASVAEPMLLIRRVLMGEDPEREPPLPRRKLRRRPLCLMAL